MQDLMVHIKLSDYFIFVEVTLSYSGPEGRSLVSEVKSVSAAISISNYIIVYNHSNSLVVKKQQTYTLTNSRLLILV